MKLFYLTLCCILSSLLGIGQTLGDYRSNGTVDFNTTANWQVLTALPSTWTNATVAPVSALAALGNSNTITILPAHTLRFLSNVSFGSNTNFKIIIQGTVLSSSLYTVNYGTGSSTVQIERSANFSSSTNFQNHNFKNLILVGTSGTPTFSFTAALKIANSLTVTNANLSFPAISTSSSAVTVNASGNISFTGAQSLNGTALTMNFSGNTRSLNFQSTLGLSNSGSMAVNFSGTGGSFSVGSNVSLDNSNLTTSFVSSSSSPGVLTFNSTVSLSNNSIINLNGDYATLDATSIDLQLSSSTVSLLGNNQTFTAINSATITLTNGSYIKLLASNGLLNLGTGSTFSGGNSSNYVQLGSSSYVKRQVKNNNSFAFPIGTATYYLPINLNNPPSGGSPNFTVGVFTGATVDANPSGTPLSKSTIVDAVWLVSIDASTTNPLTVDLGWQSPLEGSVFQTLPDNQIGLATLVRGSSTWSQATAGTAANHAAGTFTSSTYYVPPAGTQRAFALGQISIVLPVNFRNFTGYASSESSKLSWTAMTSNVNSHFEVERASSANGKFQKIAGIPAKAVGDANYDYTDLAPSKPESYYRIKIVEDNGNYSYSKTVKLSFSGLSVSVDNLYPSVCTNTVNLLISSSRSTQLQITVVDLAGRTTSTQPVVVGAGTKVYSLDVSRLAKGQYFLVMNGTQQVQTGKFIKQ